jgi:hypothetical protein
MLGTIQQIGIVLDAVRVPAENIGGYRWYPVAPACGDSSAYPPTPPIFGGPSLSQRRRR